MFAAQRHKAAKTTKTEPPERVKVRTGGEGPIQANPLWFRLSTCVPPLAAQGSGAPPPLQPQLALSQPGDPYEQEADRVAEQVMRMPGLALQRACAACGADGVPCPNCDTEKARSVQRRTESDSDSAGDAVPDDFLHGLGSGRPLDASTRLFMESRFGQDFGGVRIHTGAQASESARTVHALAYTVGPHIAFAEGQYAPSSSEGRRLLAHELTHVIQQSGTSVGVQRGGGVGNVLQRAPECARPAGCPNEFCLEYPDRAAAKSDRDANRDRLLSLVGQPISDGGVGQVRTLYGDFLDGGHEHRDLSDRLASFFTKSSTTGRSIRFLERSLEEYFRARLRPGDSTTVKIQEAIPQAIAALGTAGDPNVMAFRDYTETPGVLAGGVGVGQAACPVGAKPSTVEDSRTASGTATGTNSNGTISVSSSIEFKVTDTLDFCPGNCGGSDAQELTVPLSRYEASGISGDEPFTVKFPAPIGAFDSE